MVLFCPPATQEVPKIKKIEKMKNRSNTVLNRRIFPKIDSYRETENNSVEKKGISTKKENPYV